MKTCVDTNVLGKAPSVAQAKSGGAVVLLADDNPVCREILLHQLNAPGYAAESAENGLQALNLRESDRPCACSS